MKVDRAKDLCLSLTSEVASHPQGRKERSDWSERRWACPVCIDNTGQLREDDQQLQDRNGTANLALLRRLAVSLLRQDTQTEVGKGIKYIRTPSSSQLQLRSPPTSKRQVLVRSPWGRRPPFRVQWRVFGMR